MSILLYSPQLTPRLRYITKFLFGEIMGAAFNLTSDKVIFMEYSGPKINYSDHPFGDEIFLYATRLLFEKGIRDQQINVFEWNDTKAFYATHPRYAFPFDVFAASFYLVSRYEEYLPQLRDEHNRFSPSGSLAFEKKFLQKPLIDIWVQMIKKIISERFPRFTFSPRSFRFLSTIDVDSAYAYRGKGLMRNAAAGLRSLINADFSEIAERVKVLAGMREDPYDTYAMQLSMMQKYKFPQLYFFLLGDYGRNDKNVPFTSARFQVLMKSVSDYAQVGIHPSYASNQHSGILIKEINRLSKILKREVTKSRQHYLKLNLPETYRRLTAADITEDYTMGYASQVGFRASTCTPFFFYDLDLETECKLKVFPFALMDGTLREYMKLSPGEATDKAKSLIDEVKKVNGMFISLWHNHTLSNQGDWEGWLPVYEEIIKYAACP